MKRDSPAADGKAYARTVADSRESAAIPPPDLYFEAELIKVVAAELAKVPDQQRQEKRHVLEALPSLHGRWTAWDGTRDGSNITLTIDGMRNNMEIKVALTNGLCTMEGQRKTCKAPGGGYEMELSKVCHPKT